MSASRPSSALKAVVAPRPWRALQLPRSSRYRRRARPRCTPPAHTCSCPCRTLTLHPAVRHLRADGEVLVDPDRTGQSVPSVVGQCEGFIVVLKRLDARDGSERCRTPPVRPTGTLPSGGRRRNGHSGASCVTMRDGSYAHARRSPGAARRTPRSAGGGGGPRRARTRAALGARDRDARPRRPAQGRRAGAHDRAGRGRRRPSATSGRGSASVLEQGAAAVAVELGTTLARAGPGRGRRRVRGGRRAAGRLPARPSASSRSPRRCTRPCSTASSSCCAAARRSTSASPT